MAKQKKRGGAKSTRKGQQPPSASKTSKRDTGKSKKEKKKKKISRGFAKNNNYNRIRSLIWKKNKGDFKSYRETAKVASAVYTDCKFLTECTEEDIQGYYLERKGYAEKQPPIPEIPSSLLIPQDFWEIADVPFVAFPKYLWVISPSLLAAPSERLGISISYEKHLRGFVRWCNLQRKLMGITDSDEYVPKFIFTQPFWNATTNRWETELFTCDDNGQPFDYGYNPDALMDEQEEMVQPPEEVPPEIPPALPEKPPVKPPEKPPIELDIEEQRIRIEGLRADLDAKKQRLRIEVLKAEAGIKKGERIQLRKNIRLLAQRQEKIKQEIREMRELQAPKELIDSLFSEYTAVTNKLKELESKLD